MQSGCVNFGQCRRAPRAHGRARELWRTALRAGGAAAWLFACQASSLAETPRASEVVREGTTVFGTRVELTLVGLPETEAHQRINEVFELFADLHAQLHAWQPSELTRLNAAIAERRPFRASARLAAMLREARELTVASGGLFDPGIGRLIGLWGFQRSELSGRPPGTDSMAAAVAASRPSLADLDIATDGTVTSRNPAVAVDLGGYAKGWALDEAAALLRRHGVRDALIDVGGNLLALGRRGDRPWRVGVRNPRKPGVLATIDLLDGEAIGTSGDYYRAYLTDGVRYAHILDPRSGEPARASQAATVLIGPGRGAGALSDGASKPLFILGPQGALAAAKAMGVDRALIVDARGEVWLSPAMAARVHRVERGVVSRLLVAEGEQMRFAHWEQLEGAIR